VIYAVNVPSLIQPQETDSIPAAPRSGGWQENRR
jgi:hypothetical protein